MLRGVTGQKFLRLRVKQQLADDRRAGHWTGEKEVIRAKFGNEKQPRALVFLFTFAISKVTSSPTKYPKWHLLSPMSPLFQN